MASELTTVSNPEVSIEVKLSDGSQTFSSKKYTGTNLQEFIDTYGEQETFVLAVRMFRTDIQNRVRESMRDTKSPSTNEDLQKMVDEYKPTKGFREADPEKAAKKVNDLIAAINAGAISPEILAALKASLPS